MYDPKVLEEAFRTVPRHLRAEFTAFIKGEDVGKEFMDFLEGSEECKQAMDRLMRSDKMTEHLVHLAFGTQPVTMTLTADEWKEILAGLAAYGSLRDKIEKRLDDAMQ